MAVNTYGVWFASQSNVFEQRSKNALVFVGPWHEHQLTIIPARCKTTNTSNSSRTSHYSCKFHLVFKCRQLLLEGASEADSVVWSKEEGA